MNLYGYVGANPVGGADPYGTMPTVVAGALIGGVIGGGVGAYDAWQNGGNVWIGAARGAGTGIVAGAAAGLVGPAVAGWCGGGIGGSVAGGAAGGAAGDIASQGAGMALGTEKCYSWQRTAFAGVTGSALAFTGSWLNRPYWRYVGPRSLPTYDATGSVRPGTWLTRGLGWKPPYSDLAEAQSALQIPNPVTAVEPVQVPFTRFVGGPRYVHGNPHWGAGGGWEYKVGEWLWPY